MVRSFVYKATIGLCFIASSVVARVIEQVAVFKKVERLDGIEFTYIERASLSGREEKRFVDGQAVEADEYREQLMQARLHEWEQQEEREQALRVREFERKRRARFEISKKIIAQAVASIDDMCAKIKEYSLIPFAVYSPETLVDQTAFDELIDQIVPEARDMIGQEYCDGQGCESVESMRDTIESCQEKFGRFFEDTCDYAVNHADDTKLLKKLFELMN